MHTSISSHVSQSVPTAEKSHRRIFYHFRLTSSNLLSRRSFTCSSRTRTSLCLRGSWATLGPASCSHDKDSLERKREKKMFRKCLGRNAKQTDIFKRLLKTKLFPSHQLITTSVIEEKSEESRDTQVSLSDN